ncbi:hypothetical protein Q6A90_05035 [Aliarcobacter skirrowii]|uniref:hypothetical protein n=1 Tax=Aliarcobacter skirrowii TaxID=28200 RepID=UPI0029B3EDDD|nr:hypothetical protein [Aliarcobacter skirrowii]MDX4061727.1 hypothetical protein [Aliarcobacter skirrowii]
MSDIVKLSPFDESRVAKEGTQNFRENAAYSWTWMVAHVKEVNLLINDLNQYRGNLNSIIANYLIEALDENGINKELLALDKVDNTRDIDKPISTETKNYVDARTPRGVIVMWSGATNVIPTGWALCDGQNGTPDLRDRFVVGAGSTYGVGVTGGSKDAVVVAHTHTQVAHSHTASTNSTGAHTHTVNAVTSGGGSGNAPSKSANAYTNVTSSSSGAHSHTVTVANETPAINSTGVSGVDKNLPPYYALAYIMKT